MAACHHRDGWIRWVLVLEVVTHRLPVFAAIDSRCAWRAIARNLSLAWDRDVVYKIVVLTLDTVVVGRTQLRRKRRVLIAPNITDDSQVGDTDFSVLALWVVRCVQVVGQAE